MLYYENCRIKIILLIKINEVSLNGKIIVRVLEIKVREITEMREY